MGSAILVPLLAFGAVATVPSVASATASGPQLSVNAGLDRHHISADIYGVNFADTATAKTLGISVDRWGGNSTTRYNYKTGFHNTGADWFFENIPPDSTSVLPHDAFIKGDRSASLRTILTVPLIGCPRHPQRTCIRSPAASR